MPRVAAPTKQPPATPQTDFGEKVKAHTRYVAADGKQVPGVTTILGVLAKPALVPWANRMGLQGIDTSKYVDEAASIGTLAHALIMESLGGVPVRHGDFTADQLARAKHGVVTFTGWLKGKDFTPQLLEQPLVSEIYRYGGTIDILATLNGELVLIDLKTSSGIYDEHIYQLGGYWKLLDENQPNNKISGARILRIGRTEGDGLEERVLTGAQVLNGWRVFEHCLAIWALKRR